MESKFDRNAAVIARAWPAWALAALIAACGGGGSSPANDDTAPATIAPAASPGPATLSISSKVRVYQADLGGWRPNSGRWYSYVQSDGACASGVGFATNYLSPASCFEWLTGEAGAQGQWIGSTGPWWIDPNHMQQPGGTGLGFINVLAFSQIPAALQAPADLDDSTVTFNARVSSDFSTLVADSAAGRLQGHVYLWFQTSPRPVANCTPDAQTGENCTRQSDYILTGGWNGSRAIDLLAGTVGRALSFRLSAADANLWTCLGAGLNVKYDCLSLDQALRQVAVIGFIVAPVAPCPTVNDAAGNPTCDRARVATNPAAYFNRGRFEVQSFQVTRNTPRATTASRLAFTAQATSTPARDWTPLRYAERSTFGNGAGVHMVLSNTMPATRIGLAADGNASTFEAVGYQLYVSPIAAASPGQFSNALLVVARGDSGAFDNVVSTQPFANGDSAGVHLDHGRLLFLRNGEVIYTAPSPCGDAPTCELQPFAANTTGGTPAPDLYRY